MLCDDQLRNRIGVSGLPALTAEAKKKLESLPVIECKREDGVLTVRVRYRNTTDKKVKLLLINKKNFDEYYVTAGSKKYLMMRDPQNKTASPQEGSYGGYSGRVGADLAKGGTYQWWAKYPAPPADVKKISYYTPLSAPFDNVPISD